MTVDIESKSITFTNGTANDATQVNSEMAALFDNDAALKVKVDALLDGDIEDSGTLTLNKNVSGSPSADGVFEVERGTSTNTNITWDETTDQWKFTDDGTNYYSLFGYHSLAPNGPLVGGYYTIPLVYTTSTTVATANRLYFFPLFVPGSTSYDTISLHISTGAAGNVRLGIYKDNGTGQPGSLLIDGGTASTAGTGIQDVSTSDYAIKPGQLYWGAAVFSATPTFQRIGTDVFALYTSNLSATGISAYYQAHTYGALPASASSLTGTQTSAVPIIGVKKAT